MSRTDLLAPKLKSFSVWFVSIYFLCFVIVGLALLSRMRVDPVVTLHSLFRWKLHRFLLIASVAQAAVGSILLWVLPIRRNWVGIGVGVLTAALGVAAYACLAMHFFGGFEENVDIAVTALLLLLPSCIGGAYAGHIRVKANEVTAH